MSGRGETKGQTFIFGQMSEDYSEMGIWNLLEWNRQLRVGGVNWNHHGQHKQTLKVSFHLGLLLW